jgi:hypothetical protein
MEALKRLRHDAEDGLTEKEERRAREEADDVKAYFESAGDVCGELIDTPRPPDRHGPRGELTTMNVESCELGRYSPVSDLLVLAAVERSRRHDPFTFRRQVAHHLGFKHRAATTRGLRRQLEALRDDGSLAQSSGREVWLLTRRGSARLVAARRGDNLEPLPESPQHRKWRHAREVAEARSTGFGAQRTPRSMRLTPF